MNSTTKKYRQFCSEGMRGKSVKDLPGIGEELGRRLEARGYREATDVYAKAQSFNFDKRSFMGWIKTECGANSKQSSDCFDGLRSWNDQFGEPASSSGR